MVAQLWRVREGNEPTGPESRWIVLSLNDCVQKLSLTKDCFVKSYPNEGVSPVGPTFGDTDGTDFLARYRNPTILVVEITVAEASEHGWDAGFYRAHLSLADAETRLA